MRHRWAAALGAPATTLAVGGVCAVVAGVQAGERGVVSALVGTAAVALFFWSGVLPLLLTRGQEDRAALGLAVLLVNYTLRLAVALLLLRGAESADLVDGRVLGITIILATVTWTATQVALLTRGSASV